MSSLEALSAVIESVGPLVTPPLASSILHLPMTGLTPSAPAQQAMLMLQLLMACVRSGNSRLCPPTSAAIQLLREVASHHASREVRRGGGGGEGRREGRKERVSVSEVASHHASREGRGRGGGG